MLSLSVLIMPACSDEQKPKEALSPTERERALSWAMPWQHLVEPPTVILRKQLQNALKRVSGQDLTEFVVVAKRKGRNDYLIRLKNDDYLLLLNVGQEKLPLMQIPLKDLDAFAEIMVKSRETSSESAAATSRP